MRHPALALSTDTQALAMVRTTLGSMGQPEVNLLTASGNVGSRNGTWSAALSEIAIFDGTYVGENAFAGDAIGTEHRRNLYRVIIGRRAWPWRHA